MRVNSNYNPGILTTFSARMVSVLAWTRQNTVLCVIALVALFQLPICILYLTRDKHETGQSQHPVNTTSRMQQGKPAAPALPHRSDPFVPFSYDNTIASNTTSGQSQISNPTAMSQALSGSAAGGNLPPMAVSVQPKKPVLKPLPSPAELLKRTPKLQAIPAVSQSMPVPASPATISEPEPTIRPKLQGVVVCRGCRVAVFELEPGRIVNIRPYERIPETTFAAKAIRDDGVFVVDTSQAKQQFKYIPIGKTVEERL